MANMKPTASLSLDLDNQWSYMKTHGDAGWETFPSYLDVVVPRVLAFLKERGLTITFFVVGQDAALEKNREPLRAIAEAGHEIGNHSFRHEPWLHLYSDAELDAELDRAEEAIVAATGSRPIGFRGPGFSLSRATLEELERRGYLYDASTFPTFVGPLARAYYFMKSRRLDNAERQQRKMLFGTFREGFRPLRPYRWKIGERGLIEIPVTTMPLIRVPIHLSYLLYLGCYSPPMARAYFAAATRLCRLTGTRLSFLLHPLDFLGCDDVRELAFFPAMGLPAARKLALADAIFSTLMARFRVVTMAEHARAIGPSTN
jgi:peptidoglycan-N-acetylglucosamine deacetylase